MLGFDALALRFSRNLLTEIAVVPGMSNNLAERLGSALLRMSAAIGPNRKPTDLEWYVAEFEAAADQMESGRWKPAPVVALRVEVDPFGTDGSVEGIAERLLEFMFPIAVGSLAFPQPARPFASRPDPDVFWTDDEVAEAIQSGRIKVDNARPVAPADDDSGILFDDEECPF